MQRLFSQRLRDGIAAQTVHEEVTWGDADLEAVCLALPVPLLWKLQQYVSNDRFEEKYEGGIHVYGDREMNSQQQEKKRKEKKRLRWSFQDSVNEWDQKSQVREGTKAAAKPLGETFTTTCRTASS